MYICSHCDIPYDAPLAVRETEDLSGEGHYFTRTDFLCPLCGYPADLANDLADLCDCSEWKSKFRPTCAACHKKLLELFNAFADELTAGQEQDLDDLLDGVSVADRKKFI